MMALRVSFPLLPLSQSIAVELAERFLNYGGDRSGHRSRQMIRLVGLALVAIKTLPDIVMLETGEPDGLGSQYKKVPDLIDSGLVGSTSILRGKSIFLT